MSDGSKYKKVIETQSERSKSPRRILVSDFRNNWRTCVRERLRTTVREGEGFVTNHQIFVPWRRWWSRPSRARAEWCDANRDRGGFHFVGNSWSANAKRQNKRDSKRCATRLVFGQWRRPCFPSKRITSVHELILPPDVHSLNVSHCFNMHLLNWHHTHQH